MAALTATVVATHYLVPILSFVWYLLAVTTSAFSFRPIKEDEPPDRKRKPALLLSLIVIATYLGEGAIFIARAIDQPPWRGSEHYNVYLIASLMVWLVLTSGIVDSERPTWYPFYGAWGIVWTGDLMLLCLSTSRDSLDNPYSIGHLVVSCIRLLLLVLIALVTLIPWASKEHEKATDEECQPLLNPDNDAENGDATATGDQTEAADVTANGNADATDGKPAKKDKSKKDNEEDKERKKVKELREKLEKRLGADGNWITYIKGFSIFFNMIWPTKRPRLFLNMIGVMLILLMQRVLNVGIPLLFGAITNDLAGRSSRVWSHVALYLVASWATGSGLLEPMRQVLWYPVEQYSYFRMSTSAYNHVMDLSMDFHQDKSSGDTYGAIRQGRSVNDLMETVLFEIAPMVLDLTVAFGFLYHLFGSYMALVVAVVSTAYIWASTRYNMKRKQVRRAYRDAAIAEGTIAWETLSGWITVSYFNRHPYEQERFGKATSDYLKADYDDSILVRKIGAIQMIVQSCGLYLAISLAVYQIMYNNKDIGSFVILLSYWRSLFYPLDFFSRFHRRLQSLMLDAEKLLELLQKEPTVKDAPDAKDLSISKGDVEFLDVMFSYDTRKSTLKNINIVAPGGSTTALVGETGGGKSTIIKLLPRFYDVQDGSVKIDGQDVREVTQYSLRQSIGVVPQDPSMFNLSIMDNVKYARLEATDEDVIQACKDASLHDKIMTFPDGYESKVGERGVKLSGGELQRLAIARAMIKRPKILLLDEATSAVDTETERKIQDALTDLTEQCTTFIIAHRLSTIVNADNILVINEGEIIEHGSHDELFDQKGRYYQLWQKQFAPVQSKGGKPGKAAAATFVNDMEGNAKISRQIEAARQEAAEREEAEKENKKSDDDGGKPSKSSPQDIPTTLSSSNKEKGKDGVAGTESSWKPEAPEFVPRSLQKHSGNTSQPNSSSSSRPGSSGVGSSLPKEEHLATLESVKNARKLQKTKQRPGRKSVDEGLKRKEEDPPTEGTVATGFDGAEDRADRP